MIEKPHVVCFGEILWDNLKDGRRLGGAPLNVCYHLNKLGIGSTIVAQIGSDKDGADILTALRKLGIDNAYCSIRADKPTSTVEVVLGANHEVRYDIIEDVAWDYIETTPGIEQLAAEAAAFVFGSLIARSPVSRNTLFRLIEKSRFRVFDVNLRHPYYSKDLVCSLLKHTNLLKLNGSELDIISRWMGVYREDNDAQIASLQQHFPGIGEIILTLGAEGAVYYTRTLRLSVAAQPVEIKDTVGSGDAFLAGFLAHKMKGHPPEFALQAASMLSAFVAGKQGACPEYHGEDVVNIST